MPKNRNNNKPKTPKMTRKGSGDLSLFPCQPSKFIEKNAIRNLIKEALCDINETRKDGYNTSFDW